MACHPKLTVARVKAHRRSLCELWWASFACIRERRMERETGIEPATNSLEGCDSTTELLPHFPSHVLTSAGRASGANCLLLRAGSLPKPAVIACGACDGNAAGCQPKSARRNERWLVVAREGIEPSKPLGRQIYSLLRLTAPQPRRACPSTRQSASLRPTAPGMPGLKLEIVSV